MSKRLRKYTREFKEEAVKLALQSPSIAEVGKSLGLPVATLYSWVSKLKGVSLNTASTGAPRDASSLYEENRRLHKELAKLMEEKAILKKAAAYFAQDVK